MTFAMWLAKNKILCPQQFIHNPQIKDKNNMTVAMHIANNGIIPQQQWEHDPMLQLNDGNTVAMLLASNGIEPPKQWYHDPQLQNNDKYTVALYLASNKIKPQTIWFHNPTIKDKYGFNVQNYLWMNNIYVPRQWRTKYIIQEKNIMQYLYQYCKKYNSNKYEILSKPEQQNNDSQITFSMYLAMNGIQALKQFYHNKDLKDSKGKTVCDYLREKNIKVSEQWNTDKKIIMADNIKQKLNEYCQLKQINDQQVVINYPGYQKFNGDDTFAMWLANQKIIAPKEFEHNPIIQNKQGYTVAIILTKQGIIPPKQWQHDSYIKNYFNKIIKDYLKNTTNQISEQQLAYIQYDLQQYCQKYNINPQLIISNPGYQKDNYSDTFSMYLAKKGKISPQIFQHDPNIQNNNKQTVAMILIKNNLVPPENWIHNSTIQDEYGNTIAMILVQRKIKVPQQWIHYPELQNNLGNTVAMMLAYDGVISPQEWEHDPSLQNREGYTVQDLLAYKNILVPEQWKINQIQISELIQNNLNLYCTQYQICNQQVIINNPGYQENVGDYTFAMWLTMKQIECPIEFQHDPSIQNKQGFTVAMLLANNKIVPQKCWNHNPELQSKNGDTVAMYLAYHGINPPKQWEHYPNINDNSGYTVALYLAYNKIIPPKQWQIKTNILYSYIDNKKQVQRTIAHCLAEKGIIPPQDWLHNTELKDSENKTVEDYLSQNNIQVPQEWKTIHFNEEIEKYLDQYHEKYNFSKHDIIENSSWQNNKDENTFALYISYYGIIPSKEFQHDPKLQNIYENTVAIYLEKNKIQTPKEWQYDPLYKLKNDSTTAMKIASYGIIPSNYWNHNPILQNKYKMTVAMYLASKGIIPPKEWEHDPYLKNNKEKTVYDYLKENNIKIPQQWKTVQFNDQIEYQLIKFCKKYKTTKSIIINNPAWNNNKDSYTFGIFLELNGYSVPKQLQYNRMFILKDGYTTALKLAEKGKLPSKYWHHNTTLTDNIHRRTVAMHLANKGIDPTKYWYHNPIIKDNDGKTVEDYLQENYKDVPDYWNTDIQIGITQDMKEKLQKYCEEYGIENQQLIVNNPQYQKYEECDTFAMWLVKNKYIPPREFLHQPDLQVQGFTVALLATKYNVKLNKFWNHNPEIQTIYGDTVAMLLAKQGIIPHEQWYHDPQLQNCNNDTVAIILSEQGIIPPKEWMHDIYLKNNNHRSIELNLLKCNYIYTGYQFIYDVETKFEDDICQICQQQGKQEFIKSNCTHNICLQCFKILRQQGIFNHCPVCKNDDWFTIINDLSQNNTNSQQDQEQSINKDTQDDSLL